MGLEIAALLKTELTVCSRNLPKTETESRSVTAYPLNGTNYPSWSIQYKMALMKEVLWSIVNSSEHAPGKEDGNKYAKFIAGRSWVLATIVLSIDPALLYLIGNPEDPVEVWRK